MAANLPAYLIATGREDTGRSSIHSNCHLCLQQSGSESPSAALLLPLLSHRTKFGPAAFLRTEADPRNPCSGPLLLFLMPRRIPRRRGDEIKRRECRVSKLARIYGALCNTAFLNSPIYPVGPSTYHMTLSQGERERERSGEGGDRGAACVGALSQLPSCSLTLCVLKD